MSVRSPAACHLVSSSANFAIVSVRCEATGCKWRGRFTRAALSAASLLSSFEQHYAECVHVKNMELERSQAELKKRNKELEARLLLLSQVKIEKNEAAAAAAGKPAQSPSSEQPEEERKESNGPKEEASKETKAAARRSSKRSNEAAAAAAAGGAPAAAAHPRSKAARRAQTDAAVASSSSVDPAEVFPPLESPHSGVSRASRSPPAAAAAASSAVIAQPRRSEKLLAMPTRHLAVMQRKSNSPDAAGGEKKEEEEEHKNEPASSSKSSRAAAAAAAASPAQSSGRPVRVKLAPNRLVYDDSNEFYRISASQIRVSTLTSALSYAGSTLPVYLQGYYHYFDFQELLPLMVQKGLLSPRPPGSRGVVIGCTALEWLHWWRDHQFSWTPRCGSKKKYKGGYSYRPDVLEDTLLVSGEPYIAASFVDEQILFLAHMTDAEAKSKTAEVKELKKALQAVRATEPAAEVMA